MSNQKDGEKDERDEEDVSSGVDSSADDSGSTADESISTADESNDSSQDDGASDDASQDDGESQTEPLSDAGLAASEALVDGPEGEILPTQLGTQRYVFAAFFAGVILGGYIVGKLVHGVWAWSSNRFWFYDRFPRLAAVPDDSKTTYGLALGGLIALIVGIRSYRKPDIRRWTDEVTAEMTKVKWPTRKEVYGSTVVVIAASLLATVYLFLLDQCWSYVTGLVYGGT